MCSRLGVLVSDEVFSADWLALREAADHRSRAHELADRLGRTGQAAGWTHVLDLGSGTGSNLRYLAPRWPWVRSWTLLDHDARLLGAASAPGIADPIRLVGDLAAEGVDAISSADVVTASALLDLVSEEWMTRVVDACAARGAAALFTLSYDGSIDWRDEDPDDGLVREAMNAHQRREKGIGRALGPDATVVADRLFREAGYKTYLRPSPWILNGLKDRELTLALMQGWIEASIELRPTDADRLRAWQSRRAATVQAGAYEVMVGHYDLLALPSDP